jgi:hypothetical protein
MEKDEQLVDSSREELGVLNDSELKDVKEEREAIEKRQKSTREQEIDNDKQIGQQYIP